MSESRTLALSVFLTLAAAEGLAQQTVRGVVTDAANGTALIGATVLVTGTSVGTITDFGGRYRLEVTPPAELTFGYVGYTGQTRRVEEGTGAVDLALASGEVLEEVVVIGYGSVRKDDLTGSVEAVEEGNFNRGAIVSPTSLIAGKVAGVQITPNDGAPGSAASIRIRGGTSVNASNEPLFVVDGVPLDNAGFAGGRNPLNFLNPDDVATVTVLKDASATAIYGSRGANGVVLVTTKRGEVGQAPRVTYDGSATVSQVLGTAPVLGPDAFRAAVATYAEARRDAVGAGATDWFDLVTRTATGQQHSLGVTGGGEAMGYRVGAGYTKIEGVLRGSQTERTSASLALHQDLFDARLGVDINVKGARTQDRFDPGAVGNAWSFDPTQPVYAPDGDQTYAGFFEYGTALAPRNPVSQTEQISDVGLAYRGLGNVAVDYDFRDLLPGLTGELNLGYDVLDSRQNVYWPTTYATAATNGFTGEARVRNGQRTSALLEGFLAYARTFGTDHDVRVQGGYSYQDFRGEFPEYRAFNFENDLFGTASTVAATEFASFNSTFENRLISFFGRANYNWRERVLVTATVRQDGSTRFGPGNRWGTFPSAAVAWRLLEEPFAGRLADVFSTLKLRVGWGITGNQDFGNFLYLPRYQLSDVRTRYQFGERFVTTARPNGYDETLRWEGTTSTNVGLDFGLAGGRYTGSLEYYRKRTDDLLFTVDVPAGTNLTDRVLTNVGAVRNDGVELTVGAVLLDRNRWRAELGANASYNRNEVLDLVGTASAGIEVGETNPGRNVQIIAPGHPVNSFYLYEHLADADGAPRRDGIDYNEDGRADLADLYADTNGDGEVNDQDRRPVGQPAPRSLFGLTGSVTYGPVNLALTLRGAAGNRIYDANASDAGYTDRLATGSTYLSNLHTSALASGFTRPQYFSDYYLQSGAFLRLDNVTLGYTLPRVGGRLDVQLYTTAQNLLTVTGYDGLDPEVERGIDRAPYPRARTFVLGARLGL